MILTLLLQVPHRQCADIQEPVHAARQARLLALVQRIALDRPGDALLPAHGREVVRLWLRPPLDQLTNSTP